MATTKSDPSLPIEPGVYALHRFRYIFQWFFQLTGSMVGRFIMRKHNIQLTGADIEPGMRYVVAANHQTYFDPWVVPGRIPYSFWRKMGMPRAFVANRFFGYPIVGFILRSSGAFPAHAHPTDPYGLSYATYLMGRGQSIIIFPEGHISKNREWPARNGVMVLAHQSNARVIPVHLEWQGTKWWNRSLWIGIGKPFDGSKMTAQEILDRIYDLPVR